MKRPETGRKVNHYPKIPPHGDTDKSALRISGNTTMRMREPTSELAHKAPTMVWDFSRQQKVWPNGNNKALVEATQVTGAGTQNYAYMNRQTGRPYALGTMVGGSPDTLGSTFEKHPKAHIIKG